MGADILGRMATDPTPASDPSDERTVEASDAPAAGATEASTQEPEHWWEADGMPWQGRKPGRKDVTCLLLIFAVAVFGIVMMVLQPVILGFAPHVLAALGYRIGAVMVGALAATGDPWWPLLLVVGSLMAMKFDWIYWWAGKLWGRGIIDMWSGRSPRARKRNARAERLALRYETLAILLTYLPIPLPAGVAYAALGWAGTSLKKLLIVDMTGALLSTAAYMSLGLWLGAPAVELVEQYNKYLWYVSLGILVVLIGSVIVNERRRGTESSDDQQGETSPLTPGD